jgi:hypothetical protein
LFFTLSKVIAAFFINHFLPLLRYKSKKMPRFSALCRQVHKRPS